MQTRQEKYRLSSNFSIVRDSRQTVLIESNANQRYAILWNHWVNSNGYFFTVSLFVTLGSGCASIVRIKINEGLVKPSSTIWVCKKILIVLNLYLICSKELHIHSLD